MVAIRTRYAWFDRGAAAFAHACPDVVGNMLLGPVYVCPLCITRSGFRAFKRNAISTKELTEEHAPRRSSGGRVVALTCDKCNHTAGTKLEAHARRAENPAAVLTGELTKPHPVRVTLAGVTINATIVRGVHKGFQLSGMPRNNPPQAHDSFFAKLDRTT